MQILIAVELGILVVLVFCAGLDMWKVTATMRKMLEEAAAKKWNVAASDVEAKNSVVTNKANGKTLSYGDLAKRLGVPSAVRAVAGACAANKLAVAIPCHRVRRNDGALSGYRWGIARKRALLDREARA